MTAHYKVDIGATTVTENMTLTINPGDSAIFTFSTLGDFSTTTIDSIFDVVAWVDLTGDNVSYNDTAYTDVESLHIPADPIVTSPVTVPYASPATISAFSPTGDTLIWYDSLNGSNIIGNGPFYTTGLMYNPDTFYVQAGGGSGGSSSLIPDLLYYKFDASGSTVINHASNPVGNNPATISGLSIGGVGMSGTALQGIGGSASSNVINTGWSTNFSGSFTIAFWTSNVPSSSTLYYIWGDVGAGSFRCFTNGVAGANNWMARGGGLPDLLVSGAAIICCYLIPGYLLKSAKQ